MSETPRAVRRDRAQRVCVAAPGTAGGEGLAGQNRRAMHLEGMLSCTARPGSRGASPFVRLRTDIFLRRGKCPRCRVRGWAPSGGRKRSGRYRHSRRRRGLRIAARWAKKKRPPPRKHRGKGRFYTICNFTVCLYQNHTFTRSYSRVPRPIFSPCSRADCQWVMGALSVKWSPQAQKPGRARLSASWLPGSTGMLLQASAQA